MRIPCAYNRRGSFHPHELDRCSNALVPEMIILQLRSSHPLEPCHKIRITVEAYIDKTRKTILHTLHILTSEQTKESTPLFLRTDLGLYLFFHLLLGNMPTERIPHHGRHSQNSGQHAPTSPDQPTYLEDQRLGLTQSSRQFLSRAILASAGMDPCGDLSGRLLKLYQLHCQRWAGRALCSCHSAAGGPDFGVVVQLVVPRSVGTLNPLQGATRYGLLKEDLVTLSKHEGSTGKFTMEEPDTWVIRNDSQGNGAHGRYLHCITAHGVSLAFDNGRI